MFNFHEIEENMENPFAVAIKSRVHIVYNVDGSLQFDCFAFRFNIRHTNHKTFLDPI